MVILITDALLSSQLLLFCSGEKVPASFSPKPHNLHNSFSEIAICYP
jgi:hypothetical protein